jgi:hypothetical protein
MVEVRVRVGASLKVKAASTHPGRPGTQAGLGDFGSSLVKSQDSGFVF